MDSSNQKHVLLNCLDWQHEHLTNALSVVPDVPVYSHMYIRQQQITWHMQAALKKIEELRREVEAASIESEPPLKWLEE